MSDNGNEKDERTIKPCPSCKEKCIFVVKKKHPNTGEERWQVQCGYLECYYQAGWRSTKSAAVTFHNKLCALVEKGRKYNHMEKEFRACKILGRLWRVLALTPTEEQKVIDEAFDQRDEAVRLLREWIVFDRDIDKCLLNTGQFLSHITQGGGD